MPGLWRLRKGEDLSPAEKSSRLEAGGGGCPSRVRIGGAACGMRWCVQGCQCRGLLLYDFVVLPRVAALLAAVLSLEVSGFSPPAKADLICFQATQKTLFRVESGGKKQLNRRCWDVFPHSEWRGNTEHVLNWREVITLLIFLCDLIKM